jgi:hypothetical protein
MNRGLASGSYTHPIEHHSCGRSATASVPEGGDHSLLSTSARLMTTEFLMIALVMSNPIAKSGYAKDTAAASPAIAAHR